MDQWWLTVTTPSSQLKEIGRSAQKYARYVRFQAQGERGYC